MNTNFSLSNLPKIWVYGKKTTLGVGVDPAVKNSGFGIEKTAWSKALCQRIPQGIKSYNCPKPVRGRGVQKGKDVVAFKQLHAVFVSHRECYRQRDGKMQAMEVKQKKGSYTRMVLEILVMICELTPDGKYNFLFPAVIWVIGQNAGLLLKSIEVFAIQLSGCSSKSRNIYQYCLDFEISDDTMMVGRTNGKQPAYNNIRSEIHPVDVLPFIGTTKFSDMSEELKNDLARRRLSDDQYAKIVELHNNAVTWAHEWDKESALMKDQINIYRF